MLSKASTSLRQDGYLTNLKDEHRDALCDIFDKNNLWTELAEKHLNLNAYKVNWIRNEVRKSRGRFQSHMRGVLTLCDNKFTIKQLFMYFYDMVQPGAMLVLKEYMDSDCVMLIVLAEDKLKSQAEENSGSGDKPKVVEIDPNYIAPFTFEDLEGATSVFRKAFMIGPGDFGMVLRGVTNRDAAIAARFPVPTTAQIYGKQVLKHLRSLRIVRACDHTNLVSVRHIEQGSQTLMPYFSFIATTGTTLESALRADSSIRALVWRERYNVALGVASGLAYLHTFSSKPLIHGDVRSGNILLDELNEPQLADYGGTFDGHTRLQVSQEDVARTYLPYEVLTNRILTTNIDVHGFGVVMLELCSGLAPYDSGREHRFIIDHIRKLTLENGVVLDERAEEESLCLGRLLFQVGRVCVGTFGTAPPMRPLCQYLEAKLDVLLQ